MLYRSLPFGRSKPKSLLACGKPRKIQQSVSPRIALADEIVSNDGHHDYLIKTCCVEKDEAVGVEQDKASQEAGIKVIVNSGDVQTGMYSLRDVISTKGGTNIAGMLEAIRPTDVGAAALKRAGIERPEA
jgi:flotillin